MKPFRYDRAANTGSALQLFSASSDARYLGGGTNIVDLMRENVEQPESLVDISRLSVTIEDRPDGGLILGAGASNTAVAEHRGVRERFPMLARAVLSGASGQIRNMATVGGNLMQRTRCRYFYDQGFHCNKREPRSGCDAINGDNRIHAILGASEQCVSVHPSDMCVALAAVDATVHVIGPGGEREIAFAEFHRLPGKTPQVETTLQPGELITRLELPPLSWAKNSTYVKARDRASYAFALVSVAAAIDVESGVVRDVRLALGGVSHKPWRAVAAEAVLRGAVADETSFRNAADAELSAAIGLAHNAFKIELARRLIVSTLAKLTAKIGGRP